MVSAAIAFAVFRNLAAERDRYLHSRFESAARRVATKISERLDAYDQMLRGAAGLFAASADVTREEFGRYVARLRLGTSYRGVQGIGFAAIVPPGGREAFEAMVRAQGFPDFRVTPPGDRDPLTSILYLEPFDARNRRAFGFDMYSEPVRREAMEAARDGGQPATTGMVRLLQETEVDVQPGYLTYLPVYRHGVDPGSVEGRRAAIVGWAYSPMRMNDAMRGILEGEPLPFRIRIYDGPQAEPGRLLHDSDPGSSAPVEIAHDIPLEVNHRTWLLRFTGGAAFLERTQVHSTALDLGAAALLVLLLTGLSWGLVATWAAKRREQALAGSLRESEARFRAAFERAPVGIFVVGSDGRFLRVNERLCQVTGWSGEELLGMTWRDVVHPEDRDRVAERLGQQRGGAAAPTRLELRGVRRDGATFRAETSFSLEGSAPGPDAPVLGVLEDVTARHDAEERFREVAERSAAAILLVQDGAVVYVNPAAAELSGRPVEWLLRSAQEVAEGTIHPDDLARAWRSHLQASGNGPPDGAPVAYRVVRPDGSVRQVTRVARAVRHRGRPALLLTIVDLTDQERTAEELRKAQRLESLGLLAGGIAHDFNNLLTAVFGNVEDARRRVGPGTEAAADLDVALSALGRARDLTRQLLTFASGGAPSLRLLEVPRLLEEAARLGLGGSSIRARFEFAPSLPDVEADEGQMSQLLSNLVVNARQASPEGSELLLAARRRTLRDGEVPGLPGGDYVELAVQDQGSGIPPEVLPKVFDPFFTTRPSGTGLGLSTAYSIARRHGGHIAVDSHPGRGTRVTVLLPAAEAQAEPASAASAETGSPGAAAPGPAPEATTPRPLRVLLMDDDPLVLRVGMRQLRRLGAVVDAAADGAEAVRLHRERLGTPGRYDLLVLDLTVTGGMGGAEALERIRASEPGVVAVACSGYSGEGVMADPQRHGFAAALPKPYLAGDLERVLRAVAPSAPPPP